MANKYNIIQYNTIYIYIYIYIYIIYIYIEREKERRKRKTPVNKNNFPTRFGCGRSQGIGCLYDF